MTFRDGWYNLIELGIYTVRGHKRQVYAEDPRYSLDQAGMCSQSSYCVYFLITQTVSFSLEIVVNIVNK